MELPATASRVVSHTPDEINQRIQDATYDSLHYYSYHEERIPERLYELDAEWDIERVLEANASTLMLLGLGLGLSLDRRFLILPVFVSAFLLQHALQGWCPPVSVFRRLGFRTQGEIEAERYGLLSLQDTAFQDSPP